MDMQPSPRNNGSGSLESDLARKRDHSGADMPAPKRQRTILACNRCRARKVKVSALFNPTLPINVGAKMIHQCDRGYPSCFHCQDTDARCEYRTPHREQQEAIPDNTLILEQRLKALEDTVQRLRKTSCSTAEESDESDTPELVIQDLPEDFTQVQYLCSSSAQDGIGSTGEEFYGPSSNIFYLRQILGEVDSTTLSSFRGMDSKISEFIKPECSPPAAVFHMESVPVAKHTDNEGLYVLPPDHATRSLVELFFRDYGSMNPFLDKATFFHTHVDPIYKSTLPPDASKLALLDMVLAIATASSIDSITPTTRRFLISRLFFERSKSLLSKDDLACGNLEQGKTCIHGEDEWLADPFRSKLYAILGQIVNTEYFQSPKPLDLSRFMDIIASIACMSQKLDEWLDSLPEEWRAAIIDSSAAPVDEANSQNNLYRVLGLRYHNVRLMLHRPALVLVLSAVGKLANSNDITPTSRRQILMFSRPSLETSIDSAEAIVATINAFEGGKPGPGMWWTLIQIGERDMFVKENSNTDSISVYNAALTCFALICLQTRDAAFGGSQAAFKARVYVDLARQAFCKLVPDHPAVERASSFLRHIARLCDHIGAVFPDLLDNFSLIDEFSPNVVQQNVSTVLIDSVLNIPLSQADTEYLGPESFPFDFSMFEPLDDPLFTNHQSISEGDTDVGDWVVFKSCTIW
ncbi:hypothetical protein CEK25_002791 [Fusarium fujikuroi]|nr:hypothetical protein CEK25_002791 [Fusarium fujikuroi]